MSAMTEGTEQAPAVPATVGIVGGGRIGAGIAQVFAQAGAAVVIVEQNDDATAAARSRVETGIGRAAARDAAFEADAVLERCSTTTDFDALGAVQLVIEAVPEVLALKLDVLRRAQAAASEHAWLATNTSSLPVTEMALVLDRPDRFCGLHFFNPVPQSALVEVVQTPQSAPALVANAKQWIAALGKTPIVVRDAPGFASSRLGLAIALEAIRMLEEGVASAADIDTAMEFGYRHATGPLRTTDLVGLDVRLGISEYLAEALGQRFAPPQLLRDMVARGELGRKSGAGFFSYS